MKHLKTYEPINLPIEGKFLKSKYIVIWITKGTINNRLKILEIVSTNSFNTIVKELYDYPAWPAYNFPKPCPMSHLTQLHNTSTFNSDTVLYQSDHLQDIFNYLEMLSDTNKYNL